MGKPFPQEQELKDKTARLVELDMELNLDGHSQSEPEQPPAEVAKSVRPSVLEQLNRLKETTSPPEKSRTGNRSDKIIPSHARLSHSEVSDFGF